MMHEFEMLLMFLPFVAGFAHGEGGGTPAPAPAPKSTEDGSLNQFFVLQSDSWQAVSDEFKVWMRKRENDMCPGFFFSEMEKAVKTMFEEILPGRQRATWLKRRARVETLNPFAAEIFGASLCRRLGIGTSSVSVMPYKEAEELSDVFVKVCEQTVAGAELRLIGRGVGADELVLVSRRIPGTVPLSHLPSHGVKFNQDEGFCRMSENLIEIDEAYRKMRKCAPIPSSFYVDFIPQDRERIRKNSSWQSPDFRRILLARIFLGTTAGHNGNTMIDGNGKLFTIDFGTTRREDGEDLEMLFKHLQPTMKGFGREFVSDVWLLLGEIAALTDSDLSRCVDSIPDRPECGNKQDLMDHYDKRLRFWKKKYEEGLKRSARCIADLPPIVRRAFYA